MASLDQLLARHGSLLVLDAASTTVQVGLLRAGQPALWRRATGESGQVLFPATHACLREAGLSLADVPAFSFCEGPGSLLGIRTVAMALRTWLALRERPVYRYQSLPLLAQGLCHQGAAVPFTVVSDARRDTWHAVTAGGEGGGPLRRLTALELAGRPEPLFLPTAFRAWTPPPRPGADCPYDVAALFAVLPDRDLFTASPAPDAFQHEAPEYKKWSAGVHQAPAASPRQAG